MSTDQQDPTLEAEHPDYLLLTVIGERLKELATAGADATSTISEYVDLGSIRRFSTETTAGMIGMGEDFTDQELEELLAATSLFVTGFLFGVMLQQSRTPLPEVTP